MPSYLVVDSSILIFYDRKGRLEDFLQQKKEENYKVVIPEAIAQELVNEPKELAGQIRGKDLKLANKMLNSAERINSAIRRGLIQVKTVNYRKYSKVIDNARKYLSKLDATPEYAVKKGDPELIALVIQLYNEAEDKIFVATLNKGLLKALNPFSDKVEYEILKRYE